jgi:pimeloyl-ACP methyl ester carboxylesterase
LSGLGHEFNLAAIDLPGHGNTPGPGRDRVEEYAAWMEEFLRAGEVKPVLLGHSMGGAIAQTLALQSPELLEGLILWGTGARLRVLPALLQNLAQDFPAAVDLLASLAFAPAAPGPMLEDWRRLLNQNKPSVLLGDYVASDHFDVMARLAEISLPTLVVGGDQDQLTPVKYAQYLHQHIPGSQMAVIPSSGHMIHLEQPQAACAAVADFLRNLP